VKPLMPLPVAQFNPQKAHYQIASQKLLLDQLFLPCQTMQVRIVFSYKILCSVR